MIFPKFSVLSARKMIVLGVFFVSAIGTFLAQTDAHLQVSGTIKDEDSGRKLPGCVIVIFQDGVEYDRLDGDKNAGYSIELPIPHSYTFRYERDGFVSKKVVLDASQVPDEDVVKGFGFDLDMTLFKEIDGFDTSILDTPIGMGMYDAGTGKFKFDLDHTDRIKLRLENERNRLLAIEENRSKNKRSFDVAMKAGEDAMKKKNWQEALVHFDEALTLIPEEEEALSLRDKARAKLDDIATKLADKNAADDAEKAAKDAAAAKAAAEKEADRLASEDAARKRQEEADARRLAANGTNTTTDTTTDSTSDTSTDTIDSTSDNLEPQVEDIESATDIEDASARDAAVRDAAARDAAATDDLRRDAEEADRLARLENAQDKNRAEVDEKLDREEAEAKRAALLAENSQKITDEAEQYFKDAMRSESIAREEELAARVKAENDALRARELESRERQAIEQQELEELIKNSKISDSESRANAKAIMARRNELFNLVKNYDHSVRQEVEEMYVGDAAAQKQKIQDAEAQIHYDVRRYKGDLDKRRIDSESGSYEEMTRLHSLKDGSYKTASGVPYLALKDEDLPQGLYESSYKISNGIVIERTLRTGDKVIHYRKVMMRTGTYYFREGLSITSAVWRLETMYVHD